MHGRRRPVLCVARSNAASAILNAGTEGKILEWVAQDLPVFKGETPKLTPCHKLASDDGAAPGTGFHKACGGKGECSVDPCLSFVPSVSVSLVICFVCAHLSHLLRAS